MKGLLRRVHRYISLTMLVFWLLQALTGVVMVFHWELDDAWVPGAAAPIDVAAVGRAALRVQTERPDSRVVSLYPTAGAGDRFDIHVEDATGRTDIVRVDGAGRTLVERPLDYDYRNAGVIQAAIELHQTLFAGDRGRLFIGLSGLLLLSNLALGLKLAWPARGQWRRALFPRPTGTRAAVLFAWHRACGLWLALPACVLVLAGSLLALDDPLDALLGTGASPAELAAVIAPQVTSLATAPIGPARAIEVALGRFESSTLSGVRMPADGTPWYRVRVLQPGEPRRVYGTTAVYVSAIDARVLAVEDALHAPARQRFVDVLFPVHTGEIGGVAGRLVVLAASLWLLTMLTLGASLWFARRRRGPASIASPQTQGDRS